MRIRVVATATLVLLAAAGGAVVPASAVDAGGSQVIEVADPCRMLTSSGASAEKQVRTLVRSGYTGVIEVRLPAGTFSCLGPPVKDDQVFTSDDEFYLGNPIYTWTTLTGNATVRIAPVGADLPEGPTDRMTSCSAQTRISGWNDRLGRRSLGPWLLLAPTIKEDTAVRLDVHCLTIGDYTHSAIMVDPDTPGGDDDGVGLRGLTLANLTISGIGTRGYTVDGRGEPLFASHTTDGGRRTCSNGFAGVLLKQVAGSMVADSTFTQIANRVDATGPYGDPTCAATAHGLYLRHDAKRNLLVNNLFTGISGAAIDLAVRSDYNRIVDSIFNQTGFVSAPTDDSDWLSAAWVLTWWDRKNGTPRDSPVGNTLVNAAGDGLPYLPVEGAPPVPQISCVMDGADGAWRGENADCAPHVRVSAS